jgi:hypothetical protein
MPPVSIDICKAKSDETKCMHRFLQIVDLYLKEFYNRDNLDVRSFKMYGDKHCSRGACCINHILDSMQYGALLV